MAFKNMNGSASRAKFDTVKSFRVESPQINKLNDSIHFKVKEKITNHLTTK